MVNYKSRKTKLLTLPESEIVQQNYVLMHAVISKSRSPIRSCIYKYMFLIYYNIQLFITYLQPIFICWFS